MSVYRSFFEMQPRAKCVTKSDSLDKTKMFVWQKSSAILAVFKMTARLSNPDLRKISDSKSIFLKYLWQYNVSCYMFCKTIESLNESGKTDWKGDIWFSVKTEIHSPCVTAASKRKHCPSRIKDEGRLAQIPGNRLEKARERVPLKGHYGKYLAWQIVLGFLLSQEQYI